LLGCARAPALTVRASPPAAAAQDKGNPIEVPETIPLVVEVGGRRFPVPLVHATVNGVETLLIVDTGSSHNVVTSSFAAAHAIAVGTTATTGTGHANETIDARPIASLSLSVGAVSRTLTDAVVVAAPPVFEQLGIGGFLSPQTFFLATTVLDFPRHEIVILQGDRSAVTAWLDRTHAGQPRQAVAPRPGTEARKIFLEASLDTKPPVLAELDTGGSKTEFLESYAGESNGPTGSGGISVSGVNVVTKTVLDRTVVVGGLRFGPMAVESREKMEGYQGLLGMTVLAHVAVVIPHDRTQDLILVRAPE